jgi:CHAT domain-containing protein
MTPTSGHETHLGNLYSELVAPLRIRLNCRHLVIVPHGALHYVPFHALFDGARYLIDSCTISYAPSATVFAVCQEKAASAAGPPLVMGVPDTRAPLICEEVVAVARTLPGAELFLGKEASEEMLRKKGLRSHTIHLATHGRFRQDNPMFSGIRLGNAYLSLYDLYQLKVECELFTLSGCATGMKVVASIAGTDPRPALRGCAVRAADVVERPRPQHGGLHDRVLPALAGR